MVREHYDPLTVEELRNDVEADDHLVVDLHEDEYWDMSEGTVEYVREFDHGKVVIGMTPLSGPQHTSKLRIPADGRMGKTLNCPTGMGSLRVDGVYER